MGLWAGAKGMSKIFWSWECFFLIWRFKFFVKLYQMLIKDNCLCIGSDWSCTFPPKIGNTFCNIYIIKECFCTEIKSLKREVNAWRDKSRNNIIFIQQKYMMRSKNLEKFKFSGVEYHWKSFSWYSKFSSRAVHTKINKTACLVCHQ